VAIMVAALVIWRRRSAVSPTLLALTAAAVALALPLTGHATAQARPALSVGLQAVHALAGSAWLGTLLVLWLVCFGPRGNRTAEADAMVASLVGAFSPLALAGGAVAIGAGVLNGWIYVDAISQLWTTPYGRVLGAKATLAAGAAAVGAYNWRRVRPHLGSQPWSGVLRRSAAAELLIAVVLLAVTAALVGMPFPGE
jgi:putative copper export protein